MLDQAELEAFVNVFKQGGLIAYPTEAVYGLGCDPDNSGALERLLHLKKRSADKGLILLAGDYHQLIPYVDENKLTEQQKLAIAARWPGAITQILPATKGTSPLLTGVYDSIAVRVTQHPDVIAMCKLINKPIISTSANISGQPAACSWQQVLLQFPSQLDQIIKSNTLGLSSPSMIIDGLTSKVLRS